MKFPPAQLAFIGLALTSLFWASNAIIARYISDSIPPFTLAFGRWLIAFVILIPFVAKSLYDQRHEIIKHYLVIAILGFLCIGTYNTILYLAAHSTTAINITLFSASIPIITLIMSTVLLKHKPSRWQLLGIACSFLGVAIIVTKGSFYQLLSLTINPGDLMVIGIACVWSLYSVLLRKYPINLKPLALLTTFIAAGLPWLLVLTVIEWMAVPNIHVTGADGLLFLYIAVFPSILAYLFWTYGVTTVGPNVAALSTYLMPLFTAAIAIPLLGERLAVSQLLGGLLILAGLYLGSLFRANPH